MRSHATFRLVSLFFLQDSDVQGLEGFKTGLNEDLLLIYTVCVDRLPHRKWNETKQQPDTRWARQHAWLLLSFFPFTMGKTIYAHCTPITPISKVLTQDGPQEMLPGPAVPGVCIVFPYPVGHPEHEHCTSVT